MSPDAPNAMELILPNITEKRHDVAPKIKNSTVWCYETKKCEKRFPYILVEEHYFISLQ